MVSPIYLEDHPLGGGDDAGAAVPLAGPEHEENEDKAGPAAKLDIDAARPQQEQERGDDHRPGHVEPEGHLGEPERPLGHLAAREEVVLQTGCGLFAEIGADSDQDGEVGKDDAVITNAQETQCVLLWIVLPPRALRRGLWISGSNGTR
jgi:hypothetical protein